MPRPNHPPDPMSLDVPCGLSVIDEPPLPCSVIDPPRPAAHWIYSDCTKIDMDYEGPGRIGQLPDNTLYAGSEVEAFAVRLDECITGHAGPYDLRSKLLRLVNDFHQYSLDRCSTIRRSVKRRGPRGRVTPSHDDSDMDMDTEGQQSGTGTDELTKWEQEAQTWDLLRRLLPIQYPVPGGGGQSTIKKPASGATTVPWQDFLESEPLAVERYAVLQWLQQNARAGPDIDDIVRDIQRDAERGDMIAHGWLHTRSRIKFRKSVATVEGLLDCTNATVREAHLTSTKAPLITELDPDAVTRQGRQLEPPDECFERAVWYGLLEHLRRGSPANVIREWCSERTEMWRAVSMSVFPYLAVSGLGETGYDFDPEAIALWRRMCYQLCRNGGCDDYERAVYGALAGDIPSIEKVCHRWDEIMFANYNALIRSQFDSYLLRNRLSQVSVAVCQSLPVLDATQFHGTNGSVEMRLVESLELSPEFGPEALQPAKALQAAIISRSLDRYLYDQGLLATRQANSDMPSKLIPPVESLPSHLKLEKHVGLADHARLRLNVHVFLITTLLDRLSGGDNPLHPPNPDTWASRRQIQENCLVGYASFLRLAGMEDLVPLYCSELQRPRAYLVLHANLSGVTDEGSRVRQLGLIRKVGLDPLEFVTVQPRIMFKSLAERDAGKPTTFKFRILEDGPASLKYGRRIDSDFFGEDPDKVDHADGLLICTLEWQLLLEDAWPATFATAVEIYKYFLGTGHLNAARDLVNRIRCVDIVHQRVGDLDADIDPLGVEVGQFWDRPEGKDVSGHSPSQISKNARVLRELECLVRALDAMETLASLIDMSKNDPALRRDFWSKTGTEVKTIRANVEPLMKNWLVSAIEDGDEELRSVRDAYLPETILAYISVLHFAGTCLSRDYLLECMDLAAVIADKDSDVASCFAKNNRMVELVEAFASCSKALAVITGESRTVSSSSKKMREKGWRRDLWSIGSSGQIGNAGS